MSSLASLLKFAAPPFAVVNLVDTTRQFFKA